MKYGIREICDVVLRAKATQKIGTMTFQKDMPVLYFDSLKTSSLEGAATSVYATGGRGNTRLIAWEGEKTITFTMEDALISPISLAVLSGAGILEGSEDNEMSQIKHATETAAVVTSESVKYCEITKAPNVETDKEFYLYLIPLDMHGDMSGQPVRVDNFKAFTGPTVSEGMVGLDLTDVLKDEKLKQCDLVMVDYYYKDDKSFATMIDIDAEHFAGNYYLEASTLWRNKSGQDVDAEFIIPNCKIQSNFTFSLAATGDPSTFTFTVDAFPDYTKYNKLKKVLCAIRVVEEENKTTSEFRGETIGNSAYSAPAGRTAWRNSVTDNVE